LCNDPPSIQNEVGNLDPGMGQAQKLPVIYRCIEIRNKRILRLLKKKNPYTGIINCKDVENSIK